MVKKMNSRQNSVNVLDNKYEQNKTARHLMRPNLCDKLNVFLFFLVKLYNLAN